MSDTLPLSPAAISRLLPDSAAQRRETHTKESSLPWRREEGGREVTHSPPDWVG